ncbi:MAG: hypothetical protein U0166_11850 [Acidobacteriota bacterium]
MRTSGVFRTALASLQVLWLLAASAADVDCREPAGAGVHADHEALPEHAHPGETAAHEHGHHQHGASVGASVDVCCTVTQSEALVIVAPPPSKRPLAMGSFVDARLDGPMAHSALPAVTVTLAARGQPRGELLALQTVQILI